MKKLILAGAGHGHILLLKKLMKNPIKELEIILISDSDKQYYSGMLAGFLNGDYKHEDIYFDIDDLVKKSQVKFVKEQIISIDKDRKLVETSKNTYGYDYLSMNLGGVSRENFKINSDNISPVKPIGEVVKAHHHLKKIIKDYENFNLYFIGAGLSSIELSLAFRNTYPKINITILSKGKIKKKFYPSTYKKIYTILNQKNIKLIEDMMVVRLEDRKIITQNKSYKFDFAFISSGIEGPRVKFKGFKVDNNNYIWVDDRLKADENILAMGDMVAIKGYENLPKAGVFAIRESNILYENLVNMISKNQIIRKYKPNRNYLQIINCGSKKAIAVNGKFSFYGKIPFIIKDKIDRSYMKY